MGEAPNFLVSFFRDDNGVKPAAEFLRELAKKAPETYLAIQKKLAQVASQAALSGGKRLNGDAAGISEFRFFDGSGHRVYFATRPDSIAVLGISNKAGQDAEIAKSIERLKVLKDRGWFAAAATDLQAVAEKLPKVTEAAGKRLGVVGLFVAAGVGATVATMKGANASEIGMAAVDGALPGSEAVSKGNVSEGVAQASGIIPGLDELIVRPVMRGLGYDVQPGALETYQPPTIQERIDRGDIANDGAGSIETLQNLALSIKAGTRWIADQFSSKPVVPDVPQIANRPPIAQTLKAGTAQTADAAGTGEANNQATTAQPLKVSPFGRVAGPN